MGTIISAAGGQAHTGPLVGLLGALVVFGLLGAWLYDHRR